MNTNADPPARNNKNRRGSVGIVGADTSNSVVSKLIKTMEAKKKQRNKKAAATSFSAVRSRMQQRRAEDRCTKIITTLGDSVLALAISEDESLFAGAGTSGRVCLYSSQSGTQLAAFDMDSGITAVNFARTQNGARLLIGGYNGQLRVFDISRTPIPDHTGGLDSHPKLLAELSHETPVVAMAVPREIIGEAQSLPVAVMGVGKTAVYELREENHEVELTRMCTIHPMGSVLTTHPAALAFGGDGTGRLLVTGVEKVVELWFVDHRQPSRVMRPEVRSP